ncbi:MAG TPA: TolC family protein [Verrucomicrobiae bacterium]|nr:TolC family protein [Verrucomicrobiae bacterium]
MKVVRFFFVTISLLACMAVSGVRSRAQNSSSIERYLGISGKQKPAAPLLAPQDLKDHVVNGKLVLSLDDCIRLALSYNTDIHLEHYQIDTAENNLQRVYAPFDPLLTSSFTDQRNKTPTSTQLSGASILNELTQQTQFGYSQTFQTGTNFQGSLIAGKSSTNSSFNTLNPATATTLQFSVTQPLLRNRGLFPNRAPILIAQRNLKQARASFLGEVSDIIQQIVGNYWNVVLAREVLAVQQKSLDEAQKSYDHDKKALSLGALPPLDIYRSESQVASRRVGVIQAEYAVKQAEDQFRQGIAADIDPATRVLDLELTDRPEPVGELLTIDIPTALARAIANRPELDAVHQQLAIDELSIRLAHNNLKPDLELSGFYLGNGLNGYQPGVANTGIGTSLSQSFRFAFPAYGATLSLALPIKNHSAEANLADALVSRGHDQYQERETNQSILLDITTAVHALEAAKLGMEAAKVAVDLAKETLHADERKYELGAEQIFFVLDAQTQLAQAELNLIQSQVNFQLAVTQVDHATGDLLEHHHVEIVEPAK